MSLRNQIIAILGCYLLSLLYARGFFYGIKRYQLNNSAYKKRKKEETFKEWLFYSKYKDEIPKALRLLYYSVLIIHPACVIACLITHTITMPLDIGGMLASVIVFFDAAWMFLLGLFFWSSKPGFAYDRWIAKKRGQKKRKK